MAEPRKKRTKTFATRRKRERRPGRSRRPVELVTRDGTRGTDRRSGRTERPLGPSYGAGPALGLDGPREETGSIPWVGARREEGTPGEALAVHRPPAHRLLHAGSRTSLPTATRGPAISPRSGGVAVAQRQPSEEGTGGKPTAAQKAAALAAAAVAQQVAVRAHSDGETEVTRSKDDQTKESKAGKTAETEKQREDSQAKAKKARGEALEKARKAKDKGKGKAPPKPSPGAAGSQAAVCPVAVPEGPPGMAKAPASPRQDPAFRAVRGNVKRTAHREKTHQPASDKAREAQEAATSPTSEIEGKAQTTQVGTMSEAETPAFDAKAFKAQLLKRIQDLAPRTVKEADDFKSNNRLGGLKREMKGKVAEEKATTQGPTAKATAATPDTARVEPKPVKPLPPAKPGAPPGTVCAKAAVPKLKGRSEIEAPLAEAGASVGRKMSEADVTDDQLARSHEPRFTGALAAKQEAQTHSREAPQAYRGEETRQIDQAQGQAEAVAVARTRGMHGERARLLSQVEARQEQGRGRDEDARDKVGRDIRTIYERTKTEVEHILAAIDPKVERTFDRGAAAAKEAFEDYVGAKMRAYKQKRYGGWLGWARWAKDKLLGMPSKVNAFYRAGRQLYLDKMDAVIDNVVAIIGTGLTAAKAEIAKGKKEIQDYVNRLPEDLKEVGRQAGEEIQGEFDALEQSVEDKQGQLVDTLANKYKENLQAIDAQIAAMKAANRGLVDRAIDAVVGVVKTILEIKNVLLRVLAKVASAVAKIIKDPIGFLGNLIRGLTRGVKGFLANILTHLKTGFIAWLTGTLGPAGIQIPDDLFSLKGVLSLVMQILGLTWPAIRARAVKVLGETTVKVLETVFEPFKVLITEGPGGLVEYIKEKLGNLKEMVIGAVQEMLITQVIKAGVTWILGLLTPAGAFLKAAKAIYDIVMFFVQRGRQILALVESVVDAVGAIAGGAIDSAARLVETALARAIPLVIGLLASLVGLGDLGKRVQKIIQRARRPIDRAIDGLLKRAKTWAAKLLGRGAKGPEGKKKNHHQVALDAKKALERPAKAKEIPALVREKTQQARSLEQAARSKLDQRTKLVITLDDEAKTRKDGKLNFTARVTPNDETASGAVESAGADDFATEQKPLPLEYPKRASSKYPKLYFGPKVRAKISQATLKAAMTDDSEKTKLLNRLKARQRRRWTAAGLEINEYKPHGSRELPGEGPTIGIAEEWRVSRGKTLKLNPGAGTPGGKRLNRILKKYGFSPAQESLDADHVVEIQLGGQDVIPNLWPLDASENRAAGSRLSSMQFKKPDKSQIGMPELKKLATKRPVWFKISKTL